MSSKENSQELEPRVTVYSKPSGCQACKITLRVLDDASIAYNKIIVRETDINLIDELKREAEALGVNGEMPCVYVFDPSTEDTDVWFGFRPDKLDELKEKFAS